MGHSSPAECAASPDKMLPEKTVVKNKKTTAMQRPVFLFVLSSFLGSACAKG
jgi:hypothetical protein